MHARLVKKLYVSTALSCRLPRSIYAHIIGSGIIPFVPRTRNITQTIRTGAREQCTIE